jgi:mRNA-degrading endonuclease RelE of RelBE toxin-antitoxin system
MAFEIDYTRDADLDLRFEGRMAEATIRRAARRYLLDQPSVPATNRKPMRPNPLGAVWELRLGEWRVYYDVLDAARVVRILRVGRKVRERVFIRGIETDLSEQP